MKHPLLLLLALAALTLTPARADEGMWMLGKLDKSTRAAMRQAGLALPAARLYDTRRPSLKDAVVSFGGYCSGVVVSADGLVFTNHHCGFSSIQAHSDVAHDYLQDGFVARDYSEELPNPGLYARFLIR
ncbi:MAG: S46 family peptidase, partial [Prevotellaceae bacterium]|nr:S46 family peptidase [Prevotellaceae bacterium]